MPDQVHHEEVPLDFPVRQALLADSIFLHLHPVAPLLQQLDDPPAEGGVALVELLLWLAVLLEDEHAVFHEDRVALPGLDFWARLAHYKNQLNLESKAFRTRS